MRDNQQSFFVDFGSMPYTQLFNQALAEQQKKNWDSSLEFYQKLLDQSLSQKDMELSDFQASAIYHNMSLIASEKGDSLKAYVWSKKALVLNPSNQLAVESFKQYSMQFKPPTIAHQISNLDNIKTLIAKINIDVWFILSLILIFTTLWIATKNVIIRKKNQLKGHFYSPPKWPLLTATAITFFILSITYIGYLEASVLKGIVIAQSAQVQTAPGENKSVIFEAPAGLELEILKINGPTPNYYQVRYPGAFSGWISSSQIEILSAKSKHEE